MRRLACFLLLSAFAIDAHAQRMRIDDGWVEFVGLRHRSADAVVAAVRAAEPGVAFHACQAVLTGDLGYPEASVVWFGDEEGVAVTLLEPEERARVRYRAVPATAYVLPESWRPLLRATAQPVLVLNPLRGWARWGPGGLDSALARIPGSQPTEPARRLWSALTDLTGDDYALAARVLAGDASPIRRQAAIGVLATRPGDDATWHRLVQALRDPAPMVREAAMQALTGLSEGHPRAVDWAPVAADLRWLLNGTNVSAFPFLGLVLTRTDISPRLATPLLRRNTALLDATVGADMPLLRDRAVSLASALAGRDFATPTEAQVWLSGFAR